MDSLTLFTFLGVPKAPDKTTLYKFRSWLAEEGVERAVFEDQADCDSGLVHTVVITVANMADEEESDSHRVGGGIGAKESFRPREIVPGISSSQLLLIRTLVEYSNRNE